MSNRKLTILAVVAAITLVWAVIQARLAQRTNRAIAEPTEVIQGLNPDRIAAIEMGRGDEAVRLERQGDRFVVATKDAYPAQNQEVNSLLTSCLDIKASKLVTDDPANHADLGVTEDQATTVVKFLDDQGQVMTGLVIGNRAEGTRGTFVRRLPGNEVFLSVDTPWVSTSALSFIDEEVFPFERDDIAKVTVTDPCGAYTISRTEGKIVLQDFPAGKQARQTEVERVFHALSHLRFSDVMKESADQADWEFDHTFVCLLNNEIEYTVKLARHDGKRYLKAMAEYTGQAVTSRQEIAGADEEKLKETEAKFQARDAAEVFNERHLGWVYEISDWVAGNLTKNVGELVEDIPAPEAAADEAATESEPAAALPAAPAAETPAAATPAETEPAAAETPPAPAAEETSDAPGANGS